ncbi:MAG: large subunit ribosomal protein L10 [Candidatus Paceibacteria bacterium]|jgi:large subunit ribosomal protein L10
MPSFVKELISSELEQAFDGAEGLVMVSFGGLTVAETEELRGALAAKGAGFRMVQNKIARRVLLAKGYEFPKEAMQGNTGIAYGDAEATIGAAKIFFESAMKKAGKVKIVAGMLENNVLSAADAKELADVPDRDTLRAMLLGCISGPARGIVASMHAVPSGLARVLQAHADLQEEESA